MGLLNNANVKLLAHNIRSLDSTCETYMFLVDSKTVKWVEVEDRALSINNRTDEGVLIDTLPPFPPGEWSSGIVVRDDKTGQPYFSQLTYEPWASISSVWHSTQIDWFELERLARVQQGTRRNNMYLVKHPAFKKPVVATIGMSAEETWLWLDHETRIHQWIDGKGIGPKFLGHVIISGRVMGHLTEYIEDVRAAEFEDMSACQALLSKIHRLGIRYWSCRRDDFFIDAQGWAILYDLMPARESPTMEGYEADANMLKKSFGLKRDFQGEIQKVVADKPTQSNSLHSFVSVEKMEIKMNRLCES